MLPSKNRTHAIGIVDDAHARKYRNVATGVGQSSKMAEADGAARSQRVIDGAPKSQIACKDRSYPAPQPEMDVDGTLRDKITGEPWKLANVGPHL